MYSQDQSSSASSSSSSLGRVLADVEMLLAAYPHEITCSSALDTATLPLDVTLQFSDTAHCTIQFIEGYPEKTGIQVLSYRSSGADDKAKLDAAVAAVRRTAKECLEEQVEGALACCAAAFQEWEEQREQQLKLLMACTTEAKRVEKPSTASRSFPWISGDPFTEQKSTFQAHCCRIQSEADVPLALHHLIGNSSKLQRATHNMYAYRLTEQRDENSPAVLKHDNDDDGEDGAGSRLAHLLQMRQEDGVLLVVSRWFGGIKLGPKRFGIITNVAREHLIRCHESNWTVS